MRDSYKNFFEYFNITFTDVIKYGVEIDTIYPDKDLINSNWKSLVHSVENNKEVFIRGYGRDAHGTYLFKNIYKILLNNENIVKDSTNNAKPTQLLQSITGFSKNIIRDTVSKKKIVNYQVTHIFGRTKNPFLFTAPWNIVWKPKILDPFTGHESKGANSLNYKEAFFNKCKLIYSDYINEYNTLASKYFSKDKIEKALNQINSDDISEKDFKKFKLDVFKELSKI